MPRLLVVLLLVLLVGCASVFSSPPPVEIRIANASAVAFERVVVRFPRQVEDYGALAALSQSDYRAIEQAYRYASVEVQVEGEKLLLQPIDYVGESRLASGRYTYVLDLVGTGRELTLTLRREE
jgi:pyruvate carboxylase